MANSADPFLGQPLAAILLLGTFHFQDHGLDWYKPQVGFDVFSQRRQREIAEVVERLAVFQPTKIAIEQTSDQQSEIDQSYRAHLQGVFHLPGSEIYQLGFRLAKRLGHDRVHCVDNWGRHYQPQIDLEAYAREHGQEQLLAQWSPRFKQWYQHRDQLKAQLSVREILLDINQEETILQGHGHYLVDWFKVGSGNDYPGADGVTGWYNRNLRIFANLQRITETPDERILLIIGWGHLPILRHCVQASPEYNLVEVCDYLGH
ncbi:MAG: hypothetical protein KGZ60_01460 [Truepera sp.]|nr:hypothetical protein [Truepera sp.]